MQGGSQNRFVGSEISRREERIRELRHVELKYLWVQEAVAKGRIVMKKISGHYNPADVLTKPKERTELGRLLSYVGAKYISTS